MTDSAYFPNVWAERSSEIEFTPPATEVKSAVIVSHTPCWRDGKRWTDYLAKIDLETKLTSGSRIAGFDVQISFTGEHGDLMEGYALQAIANIAESMAVKMTDDAHQNAIEVLAEMRKERFGVKAERAPNPPIFPIVIALHGHLQRYGVTAILQAGVIKCTRGATHFERDIQSLLDGFADLTDDADAAGRVVASAVLVEMGIKNDLLAEGLAQAGVKMAEGVAATGAKL